MNYNQAGNFYKFLDRQGFVEFIKDRENECDSTDEWCSFFGFDLETDDEGMVQNIIKNNKNRLTLL